MDNTVIEKLRSQAFAQELTLAYGIYHTLNREQGNIFLNALNSRHQTAILILNALERGCYTYEQVADIVGRNKNTVMQYVYALSDLGYDVTLLDKTAFKPTGRKLLMKGIK